MQSQPGELKLKLQNGKVINNNDEIKTNTPSDEEYGDMAIRYEAPERDDIDEDTYDKYIDSEVEIEEGGEIRRGRVTKQSHFRSYLFITLRYYVSTYQMLIRRKKKISSTILSYA